MDRTPYLRGIMDAAADPFVEEIVCLKGAQLGWSDLCRNVMGYWVDLDPGPTLVLMPDQNSADNFKVERIDPMVKNTPAIRAHLTGKAWDDTKYRLRFDTMSIFLAWAGSKTGTKSRPIRRLICEEPDEFPRFSSSGGDPLAKAEKRLTTYRDKGQAKMLIGGTPTTRMGNAFKRWEMCATKYHFWVPCPHCNSYQRLEWKGVKWPKLEDLADRAKRAEKIKGECLAWYECGQCKAKILDHHKPGMLRRGIWASEDQVVTPDGRVVGPVVKSRRIGFKISGLYSPWVGLSQLAAEWIECQGNPQDLCDFINQRLAEPFEEQRAKTEPNFIAAKAMGAPQPMLIPKWAKALIATADTQGTDEKDGYFWYVIRAWGYDYRSQLVDFGVCSSKAELAERCLKRAIPIETGGQASAMTLVIDVGGPRWSEIYQMAQIDNRIHPAKGSSTRRTWMVDERPQKKHGVILWEIDTEQSKDLLHRLIHDPDQTKWLPHNQVNDDYCRQMCAEAKVFDPNLGKEKWIEIVQNNNHIWDCEQYQCAVAWRLGMAVPEPSAPKAEGDDSSGGSWATNYRR
jgi:phage terminase large subunit GpA-like protein